MGQIDHSFTRLSRGGHNRYGGKWSAGQTGPNRIGHARAVFEQITFRQRHHGVFDAEIAQDL